MGGKKKSEEAKTLFDEVGFSKEKCSKCGAHLFPTEGGKLICLNACHLSEGSKQRFHSLMRAVSAEQKAVAIEDQCHRLGCAKMATHEEPGALTCISHASPDARPLARG